jgi:hypothetical protein
MKAAVRGITLTARSAMRRRVRHEAFPDKAHDEHAFIETLWATRRVAFLLDSDA